MRRLPNGQLLLPARDGSGWLTALACRIVVVAPQQKRDASGAPLSPLPLMANPQSVALGMWLVAGLFTGVGIYGAVKGRHTATFLAVAVVFFIIGVAAKRKRSEAAQQAPSEEL